MFVIRYGDGVMHILNALIREMMSFSCELVEKFFVIEVVSGIEDLLFQWGVKPVFAFIAKNGDFFSTLEDP